MARISLRPLYDQASMFPPTLEEWIPDNHPARFVRDFVAKVDAQWAHICMTINLRIFMKWWNSGRLNLTSFGQQSRKLAAASLVPSFGSTSTKNAG